MLPLVLDASVGARVPKYVFDMGLNYSLIDAGARNLCICVASVLPGEHTTIAAQSDVLSVPANINNNLNAAGVTTLQNRLALLNLPTAWVDTTLTYRQTLRIIGGMFLLAQRFHGETGLDLFQALGNDTQIKNAPVVLRNQIGDALESLGTSLRREDVDPNWTFRELLQNSGIAWKQVVIQAGRMAW